MSDTMGLSQTQRIFQPTFWMMEVRPHGGTRAPFMLDWAIRDSAPKTKAECVNPDS